MNKDPLHNLKDELDKELFQNIDIPSQKRTILTKIQKQKKKKGFNWNMVLNVGIAAAIIFIVSILGSSYLPKDELADKDQMEENQEPQDDNDHSAFIPEDDLQKKIDEEKQDTQNKKRQSPVREEGPDTDDINKPANEKKEEKETGEEVTLTPPAFDFSSIIENPGEFKDQASKGILHGSGVEIGDTYESVTDKYGNINLAVMYEGGPVYSLGDNYLLSFTEKQGGTLHKSGVKFQGDSSVTVKQVINALGDPYYFYNEMNDHVSLEYIIGDYEISLIVEGLYKLDKTGSDYKVEGIDLEAKVVRVELDSKKMPIEFLTKEVRFITEADLKLPMQFNNTWFSQAKEKVMNYDEVEDVTMKKIDAEASLIFQLKVKEGTTSERGKELTNELIQEITRISENDTGEERVWDYFAYRILVTSTPKLIVEGYGLNMYGRKLADVPPGEKPHQTTGTYPPEIAWHEF
ncbi:hypothetical protein KYJ26_00475 [Bacillus sp. MCCB 382]|uniref:hypothetical protein n=1 Tax=Bacillus sp. MCCB 382 TaxID=2860197 RepID=UPI001C56A5BC|nr:hypothetical protein [Bacillus sp. MCCB 382]